MGIKGFVEGGLASVVAGCSTHPLDLIKVRMQLQGEAASALMGTRSATFAFAGAGQVAGTGPLPGTCHQLTRISTGPIGVGLGIVRAEGVQALFSGASATVLRQCLYSTTRMGLYDVLKQKWSDEGKKDISVTRKIGAGLMAGAVGAAVGNPADVAMVRMQADGRLPAAQRRNYAGVGDALCKMVRHEGVGALWRGSALTVQRAMVVTASQLATYDQAKESLLRRRILPDGLPTHVAASCIAGLVASVASNPIDVIKTRVMNMKAAGNAEPAYKGALDCALRTVEREGPMALYKGFVPTVMRQGPFTVVLFVTLEQIRRLTSPY